MHRYIFSDVEAASYGARCLDGSNAGFYYEEGIEKSVVIFLQGGGACYENGVGPSATDCAARAKTALGSSKYWAPTMTDVDNVLSSQPANPFANWSHVFVPYCSGDVWSGTRAGTVVNETFPFVFAGHSIFRAVVATLRNHSGIDAADTVLLSGSSAGGIGAFVNADYLTAALPGARSVLSAPQAGWFFPQTVSYSSFAAGALGPPYAGTSEPLRELWQPLADARCVAAHNASFCLSIGNAYKFWTTPFFVANNNADSNQIFAQQGCPNPPTSPTAAAYVSYTVARTNESIVLQVLAQPRKAGHALPDGLWIATCLLHTSDINVVTPARAAGVAYAAALGAWVRGDTSQITRAYDSCSVVGCNPTCPPGGGASDAGGMRVIEGGTLSLPRLTAAA